MSNHDYKETFLSHSNDVLESTLGTRPMVQRHCSQKVCRKSASCGTSKEYYPASMSERRIYVTSSLRMYSKTIMSRLLGVSGLRTCISVVRTRARGSLRENGVLPKREGRKR